jgi:hypothetical protein
MDRAAFVELHVGDNRRSPLKRLRVDSGGKDLERRFMGDI